MWDIRKRGVLLTYGEHQAAVSCIRFSPDGRSMVSSDRDGILKVWDLRSGKSVVTKSDAAGEITDLQFHPSEMLFAASSQDGRCYFYDFESYQLVSVTEKSTNIPSAIRFSFAGDVLTALMGDILAEFAWEPEAKRTKAIHINNGKKGDLILSQNKAIATGIKEKNQLIVSVVDSSKISTKPRARKQPSSTPKQVKANVSLPDPNISLISDRPRNGIRANANQNNSTKETNVSLPANAYSDAFSSVHKIPRSPRGVKAPSKPRAREVKADFMSKMKQKNENDIPVEIHVTPAPVVKSKRPLAMVKPNNSMEIDPGMLASPVSPQVQKNLPKPNSILSLLQQSVEVKKVLKNRQVVLEDCTRQHTMVGALRKSYRDRGVMYDLLSNLLSMPDAWTLELAVEAAQVASLLAQSSEVHHQKLSSTALKHILTHFRQTIEHSISGPHGIGVDLSAEQRQQRSKEILRLVDETRNTFQSSSQNATTLKEIDFLMRNFQIS
ncbi:Oidioi.mRNA.OKI2018_I69.chr2.g6688.t1.cds [Oikopleura dioica]|uniref:Oidioi.mRNA.OKI2018_I69.chr2.g6688.t1.cds n=1 Tax=Oikopleura dioica TaxID=34765 RepID=A0ABN7T3T5_OIKDI|nr:Oidioi.mRNA.OKI2018_I69.chr2.g6688.t1.cds [Oikopleura dioica]